MHVIVIYFSSCLVALQYNIMFGFFIVCARTVVSIVIFVCCNAFHTLDANKLSLVILYHQYEDITTRVIDRALYMALTMNVCLCEIFTNTTMFRIKEKTLNVYLCERFRDTKNV